MSPESPSSHRSPDLTQSGDLVRIEYDLWAESGGKTELLDTTHEEVAQTASVPAPEGFAWGPRPHQIGGDRFPTGIENALVGLPVGEEAEREFSPAEAFGERDPNLIELFSMHEIERLPEMRREDAHLDIGTVLTIEGRRGRVVSLTAARVRVDFNPPFSGRKVRGKFKIAQRIVDPVEQVRAILELQYGRAGEFGVEHHEKTITLKLPERSKFDISWMAAKPRVVDRLRTHLHPHLIRIVEEYVTPTPEKKKDEAEKPSAETPSAESKSPASSEAAARPDASKPSGKTPGRAAKSPSPPSDET
jgi:FKBP-type peptidyl-prolyl cis-trans isomerase 2